jgi:hypothetical protein
MEPFHWSFTGTGIAIHCDHATFVKQTQVILELILYDMGMESSRTGKLFTGIMK